MGKSPYQSIENNVYDVNASLPVLLDDGSHKYVWGLGLAFAVDTGGNPLVYDADGLGSLRALTDGSGNVVQTYQYDEYGNAVSSSGGVSQPFQYAGRIRDDHTELLHQGNAAQRRLYAAGRQSSWNGGS